MFLMTEDKYNKKIMVVLFLLFIFWIYCAYLFPYTGDDWAWGSSIGIRRLEAFFCNYNGRYAGNIAVLILTRSRLIKALTEALAIIAICVLLCNNDLAITKVVTISALLMLMPRAMLRQSIVWTAGFSNYLLSIVLLFIFIRHFLCENEDDIKQEKKYAIAVFAILAFVTGLFVEHSTLYQLLLSVFVVVSDRCRFKKFTYSSIGYNLGSIFATICMFSNGAYLSILNHTDTYKRFGSNAGIINRVTKNLLTVIGKEFTVNDIVLNCSLVLVLMMFSLTKKTRVENQVEKRHVFMEILGLGLCTTPIIYKVLSYFGIYDNSIISAFVTVLFVVGLLIYTVSAVEKGRLLNRLLFYIVSACIITMPLLVVAPIGSRCLFAAYVFQIAYIVELMGCIEFKKAICLLAFVLMFVGVFRVLSIYIPIYHADVDRLDTVMTAVNSGCDSVEIKHLPHESFLCRSIPTTGSIWEKRYKLFYDIPMDFTILIDYE